MGTITLDNGTQVRKILGFTSLAIKPTLYTDVKGYTPDQLTLYEYYFSPPNYIQGIYKRYELDQGSTDRLVLWYTVPFHVNGNVLYGDIPINYTISTGLYRIPDEWISGTISSNIGAIPMTAGSGSDTSDRVYFPSWKVGTQNYQNSVYVMRKPIINNYPFTSVRNTDRQIWAAFFSTSYGDPSSKTTK